MIDVCNAFNGWKLQHVETSRGTGGEQYFKRMGLCKCPEPFAVGSSYCLKWERAISWRVLQLLFPLATLTQNILMRLFYFSFSKRNIPDDFFSVTIINMTMIYICAPFPWAGLWPGTPGRAAVGQAGRAGPGGKRRHLRGPGRPGGI